MTTFTLKFLNGNETNDFYFFTTMPDPKLSVTGLFTNTWVKATVPKGGYEIIQTTLDYFAWCGVGPTEDPATGTIIQGGLATPVQLGAGSTPGTTETTQNDNDSAIEFLQPAPAPSAGPGCFQINCQDDFTKLKDKFMIGIAMPDPKDSSSIVPVKTIMADPNTNNTIAPLVKFYVAMGDKVQGEIIDYKTVSATCGFYDFTPGSPGEGMRYGELSMDDHGNFSPATYKVEPSQADDVDTGINFNRLIKFTQAIERPLQSALSAFLVNKMINTFSNVTASFESQGFKVKITGNDTKSPEKVDHTIEDALKDAKSDKKMPSSETWTIDP
ncbi:hypothetical protein K431DRAFT_308993 [Polychaeton citri CBS 116435]|uniref:Uncharacterized protein n=1 Tax=Polychaeton citri CBS 116435 TaxID=1314669 RepID=A0A9P4QHQ4_9PEZI|nr:hypothetical protein K431DRAFT_308993 [Polychaeton citri CBS 116435]